MEELRSTEVLDREILEDARKKAFKILKNADDTVQSQTKRWEKKTQKALVEIRKTYTGRTEKIKGEILARLPLDKRRLRSETAEMFLKNAMSAFLKGLSRVDLFNILEREFADRLADCAAEITGKNEKPVLSFSAMTRDEALSLAKKASGRDELKGTVLADAENWKFEQTNNNPGQFPAVVLETGAARIRASVKDAAEELLKEKRAELVSALLGEGVLND